MAANRYYQTGTTRQVYLSRATGSFNDHANGPLTIFLDSTGPLNFTGLFKATACTDAKFSICSKICNGTSLLGFLSQCRAKNG